MIGTIAAQQVLALRRQRTFVALLVLFVVMTALAGLIGWSSSRTINRVYGQAVLILGHAGKPVPPNPIGTKPTLSLLSNMTIYIPLVGALMAIVLGHLSIADDRSTGVGRLLFSRQLSPSSYLLGKLAGSAAVLAAVLAVSELVSIASLAVANPTLPTAGDLLRLTLFYVLSFVYLQLFCLIGLLTTLVARRRSMALLAGMGVWLVLTFAVPQFTSGLRPTASLNPVTSPATTSTAFFRFTAKLRALSLTEQYKHASADVLHVGSAEPVGTTAVRTLPLVLVAAALAGATARVARRSDWSRGASGD